MRKNPLARQTSGRPEVFDLVHAHLLRCFPELAVTLGGDPARLMRQAGIHDPHAEDGPRATYRQMIKVIELAAAQLRCPDFGMRLARLQGGAGMFGPLGRVMRNSRTFGDALHYVSRHAYAHSPAARIWLRASRGEKLIFVGHDILLNRMPDKAQAMEQILLVGHLAAMELTDSRARVRKVHFRHQPISALKVYRRNFGCPVRFGQNEDGVFFLDHDLASPIADPDSRVYESATSFIDAKFSNHSPPLEALARGVIMQYLGTEHCRGARVAAELKLHPKTMQRALKAHGTSFQRIKDEVRHDLMLYYLTRTSVDLGRLSERLGFAEQSVMTRYCNRWFAMAPSRLRLQGHDPGRNG